MNIKIIGHIGHKSKNSELCPNEKKIEKSTYLTNKQKGKSDIIGQTENAKLPILCKIILVQLYCKKRATKRLF